MFQYWLVITLSWMDFASSQYINTGGPAANSILDPLEPASQYPLPYSNHFNLVPSENDIQKFQSQISNIEHNSQFYHREDGEQEQNGNSKTNVPESELKEIDNWYQTTGVTDKNVYSKDGELMSPLVITNNEYSDQDSTSGKTAVDRISKRSFSPWGGKRSIPKYEQNNMWTWKRAANMREPSMPKRVRFSPWGGKRSGQVIYKPGVKGSKVIFSNSIPELTRFISNYSPNDAQINLAGFRIIPSIDKHHPIRILALSTKLEEQLTKESLPIHAYVETAKLYKPGHPYLNVSLKKDGKRKVKFSAWGGKRAPPIIGPIWTPPTQNGKDNTLDAILLIRNSQAENGQSKKALQ